MKELDSFPYHKVKLSKTQSSWTDEELRKVFDIPYVFAIDNMGVVRCTSPNVVSALSITMDIGSASRRHCIAVKISL
ncbi:UNVERIFIED_CONTAM: hypothetical protein Slati_3074700 [Sesamum latifolium]|uniref:Uncharacterized protein n=1 Tax=Sesamum latifolium TaxID=2727402 RepID=A0AAW2UU58_9LAMI